MECRSFPDRSLCELDMVVTPRRHGRRTGEIALRATAFLVAISLLVGLFAREASAQQTELTTADRLAILYTPQLDFTRRGDPMIRVGLLEGRDTVHFTPSEPIRVMPRGEEGPEIVLPGGHRYSVEISDSNPGSYEHYVVVQELTMNQRDRVDAIKKEWTQRGYLPRTFQVGGLFGIRGKVFDSRVILVGVGGMSDHGKAKSLRRELEGKYGINARIHSELTKHPGGLLELTGEGVEVTVRQRDVLWVAPKQGRAEEIRYTIPKVPKARGKGTETRTYSGRLIFSPDRKGQLAAINKLGAERLLKGTVPSETYASAPKGALRAQAVAARNTIFAAIGVRNLADPYMLRSDVYDQVYKGLGAKTESTSRAVEATRGEVMFHGNQIIEAVYSSNAGGFTENNENVWNTEPRPYLRGQPDAPAREVPEKFRDGLSEDEIGAFLESDFPAHSSEAPIGSSRLYRWEEGVDAAEAVEWLKSHGHEIDRIESAEVTQRGVSGRAMRVKVVGAGGGEAYVERELNIRRLFDNLKSGLFEMSVERREDGTIRRFEFEGAGYGHGVGMCQTGAIGMAADGDSYRDILTHYYRGIEIRELY